MTTRPLLVLVHGTRFDASQWEGYDHLVPGAQTLAVDLPGHGSRAGESYDTQAALAVVDAAVGSADEGQPVVLAGHSLGGYVATAYAERHPDALHALVLVGACADPSRHPVLRRLYTGFARVLPAVGAARMAGIANAVMRRLGAEPDDLPDATGYAVLPEAWAAVIAAAGVRQLEQLTCPVFLVAGQFDQLRIDTNAYAAICADPRVRIISRASHFAPITHRDAVAAVLREAVEAA